MSVPRPTRLDLTNEESSFAADIVALVDAAIEERIGRAISKSTGNVRADAVDGVIPPRSGGTGGDAGTAPHELTGDRHTASALTIGHVLTATAADAFAFEEATGGGSDVAIQDDPPASPEVGDLWIDTDADPTIAAHTHAGEDVTSGTLDPARLPAATALAQGAMVAADFSKLAALGTEVADVPAGDTAVAASTVTQVAGPITITPGIWIVFGSVAYLQGAAAGTVTIYLRSLTSRLGAGTTYTLAANTWGSGPIPTTRVSVASDTSLNIAAFASQAGTARNDTPGFSSLMTELRAVRIG